MKNRFCYFIFIIAFVLTSCNSSKNIVYVQSAGKAINLQDTAIKNLPEAKLKIGDILVISINSINSEAAAPFNLAGVSISENVGSYNSSKNSGSSSAVTQNYLIDNKGNITFPIIGEIHALGMTKTELSDYIKNKVYPFYIKEKPIVTIRYENYKVSILGEVSSPSVYYIQSERINILEAIALAGDLTIYGRRDNVLLIRENDFGKKETLRIDLRDKRLIDSPYYYLQQNDVLYIQPNNPKARSSALGSVESLSISLIGTVISLTSLIVALVRQ